MSQDIARAFSMHFERTPLNRMETLIWEEILKTFF